MTDTSGTMHFFSGPKTHPNNRIAAYMDEPEFDRRNPAFTEPVLSESRPGSLVEREETNTMTLERPASTAVVAVTKPQAVLEVLPHGLFQKCP
ncbi:MAG: hypothetical protein HUJ26_09415 [Planctomycetaceae bacterium]|nr:hypothetical protein [Planctomycetaceae bacterium]